MSKEIERGNGKDPKDDGFENVDGKAPDQKPLLGLRVTGGSFTENEGEGAPRVTLTLKGVTLGELIRQFGHDVHVETISGARRMLGHVTEVKLAEGKEQGSKVVSVKVSGGLQLAGLTGNQVRLQKAQGELPLTGADEASAEPEPEPDGPKWREEDVVVSPPPRRRRARGARAGAPA